MRQKKLAYSSPDRFHRPADPDPELMISCRRRRTCQRRRGGCAAQPRAEVVEAQLVIHAMLAPRVDPQAEARVHPRGIRPQKGQDHPS